MHCVPRILLAVQNIKQAATVEEKALLWQKHAGVFAGAKQEHVLSCGVAPSFLGLNALKKAAVQDQMAAMQSLQEIPFTLSIGDAVTFANGKTGHKFTITIGSTYKLTPQSDSAVSAFNSGSGECSKTDWVKDIEKECSTGSDAGEALLCLYQLDGNTWYPKCDDNARPSTSDIDTDNASNTFTKQ
jgi:hypothetical protein